MARAVRLPNKSPNLSKTEVLVVKPLKIKNMKLLQYLPNKGPPRSCTTAKVVCRYPNVTGFTSNALVRY